MQQIYSWPVFKLNWVSSTWWRPSTQTTSSTSNRGGGCLCLQCFGVEWSSWGRFQGMWSLRTSIVLPATPPSHIWGMTSAPSWFVGQLSQILLLSSKCDHFKYWKHFTVYMSPSHVNMMFSACVLKPLHKRQEGPEGGITLKTPAMNHADWRTMRQRVQRTI